MKIARAELALFHGDLESKMARQYYASGERIPNK
jgi:hypothetical protein